MVKLEQRITNAEGSLKVMEYNMSRLKEDVDHAHTKIRANEATAASIAKAQNKALLAILLWIKDPQHGDIHQIDEAIKDIST